MESLDAPSPLAGPDREASCGELRIALQDAIDALPARYREVFMLRSVDGCSVAETAQLLDIPQDTVKTRLHRARAKLQQTLHSWTDQDAANTFPFPAVRCGRVGAAVMAQLRLH